MTKNSLKKSATLLPITQERAKQDLENFIKDKGYLFDSIKEYQKSIEQIRKSFAIQSLPLKQISDLHEQLKSLSKSFQIAIPPDLIKSINNIRVRPASREMVYIPRNRNNIEVFEEKLDKFSKKLEDKFEEKFSKIDKSIESLSDKTNQQTNNLLHKKIDFDKEKSIIKIGDKEIKLKKGGDQYHIMRIVFENKNQLSQEWFFSEISEIYDFSGKYDDKKFYNAAYQINQKIIRDTGLKDVLFTKRHSFCINPDYLS